MPDRRLLSVPLVLLLLPLASCATKSDVRGLQEEVRELNARQEALLREIRREQVAQGDSLRALAADFGDHERRVTVQFRGIEDAVLMVQELAGISQQEIAAIRDRMDASRRAAGVEDPFDGPGTASSAEEAYQQALTLLRRGSVTAARMGFEGVIEGFPNHPLAPEARYHLADLLVQEDELEAAIDAFLEVPEFHPDADRVPDALYRVGVLHRELGDEREARRVLERVVNTWPDSGAAELARQVLREIG
jgi:tol-pal system protein YbgF